MFDGSALDSEVKLPHCGRSSGLRFMFYMELANSHRNPIVAALARTLLRAGHEVMVACEERFAFSYSDAHRAIEAGSNKRHIRNSFSGTLKSSLVTFDVLGGSVDSTSAVANERREHKIAELLAQFRPDRIVIWNGNFPYQIGTRGAIDRAGLTEKMLFLEVAWFSQREFIYLDPTGVNLHSSIRGRSYPRLMTHQKLCLDQWFDRYRSSRGMTAASPPTNALRLFVPLQVDTDTSIREGSPFSSMREFIAFLEGWIPESCQVIIKAHPKAKYDYVLGSTRQNFSIRAAGSIDEFIDAADVVVGLNSTVLLEAAALGKRVVAFGQGLFSGCGVLTEAKMDSVPAEVFSRAIDQGARDSFFYNLIYERQISIAELERANVAHLFSRQPFSGLALPPEFSDEMNAISAKEGRSMIRIGKSKVARSASLDVEKGGQIVVGDDCEIRHHAVLEVSGRYNGSIEIGNHSVIGVGNWLQGSGSIKIGNDVIIGPYVAIVSTSHSHEDRSIPIAQQPLQTGTVLIEDDVWIGAHCTITQNVTIGAHSIVGANSFVNRDVPPYSVVGGSPAKVIRSRK